MKFAWVALGAALGAALAITVALPAAGVTAGAAGANGNGLQRGGHGANNAHAQQPPQRGANAGGSDAGGGNAKAWTQLATDVNYLWQDIELARGTPQMDDCHCKRPPFLTDADDLIHAYDRLKTAVQNHGPAGDPLKTDQATLKRLTKELADRQAKWSMAMIAYCEKLIEAWGGEAQAVPGSSTSPTSHGHAQSFGDQARAILKQEQQLRGAQHPAGATRAQDGLSQADAELLLPQITALNRQLDPARPQRGLMIDPAADMRPCSVIPAGHEISDGRAPPAGANGGTRC